MWRLEVSDWTGPTGWRWRLFDGAAPVVEHPVALDPTAWQFAAFTDLYGYLSRDSGTELLAETGDWIGSHVLGPVGPVIASARGPVRLELPKAAEALGHRPWELARVDGVTLAAARVRMVVTTVPHRLLAKRAVGDRLRMLAIFSLPDGSGALNLRRERYELARLVREIAKVNGRAIELRVLQYGATRQRLQDALLEAPGWDVVHLSGHGLPAGLILEDLTGRRDTVTSTELVDLLDLAADQLKLVTLSACESAAVTAAEHLHLLGLAPTREDTDPEENAGRLPAVAAAVMSRLDCAVLAMRYPVVDEFAIDLAGSFYDLLLGKEQPVAQALALSLATGRASELSLATPALFGARATDLTLVPPKATPELGDQRLAAFPDQPHRFVGRVSALTRASAALAPGSGRPAVVLHGMAGAGKTACATELAYTHVDAFPFAAWWTAPPDGADIRPALTGFALAVERQIPDLEWVHLVDDLAKLRTFLPQLTEIAEQNRILLVIDNAESLLTEDGQWRDERWAAVIDALTAHSGLSRLVLTSRARPTSLPSSVLVESVHALSLDESMLLARELPGLRALIDGGQHELVARVLRLAQGHPKLLELADGAATDPAALTARLDEADRLWRSRGTVVDAFLRHGSSAGSDAGFGEVLAGWTRSTTAQLPAAVLLLFRLVCGLEEVDREPDVINQTWPWVWERAEQGGAAPDLALLLPILVDRALMAADTSPDGEIVSWRVHPGVVDAARADTDPAVADLVDDIVGDAWMSTMRDAWERESEQSGAWLLRAARSAAPYLLRRRRWADLDSAAEHVLARDPGMGAAATLAPLLEMAAAATHGSDDELAHARTHVRAVLRIDPARGIALLQQLLDTAVDDGRWTRASGLAGDLVNCYLKEGRYDEGLALIDRRIQYTHQAGYGPWTALAGNAQRLQILHRQGDIRAVLDEVEHLRTRMGELTAASPDSREEVVEPWNVREIILETGAFAASDLGLWKQALELNAEVFASMSERDAGPHDQARAALNAFGPLMRLGRLEQAHDLLVGCRTAFDAAGDVRGLGMTLSGLADVESERKHLDRASDLERQALRYKYATDDPGAVLVSHHNLANYLYQLEASFAEVAAHRMASAVIAHQIGSGQLSRVLTALGQLLARHPDGQPGSFGEVCALVGQVPGVDLAGLVARLPRRAPDGETALRAALEAAPRMIRNDQLQTTIAQWDPVLSALRAAVRNRDPAIRGQAATEVDACLAQLEDTDNWRALVAALRRLQHGDRDPVTLLVGLDEIDTAIARRALAILDGTATVDPDAWRTAEIDDVPAQLAAFIAKAAAGDDNARAAVEHDIADLAADPETAALAAALHQLLDGTDPPDADLPDDQAHLVAAIRRHLDQTRPPETP